MLLSSCGSRKSFKDISVEKKIDTVFINKVQYDTIIKERVITKTLPGFSQVRVENPCDEQGKIRPLNATVGSGFNKSNVRTENGELVIELFIDSTRNSLETFYRNKFVKDSTYLRNILIQESIKEKETVKTVCPWWLWTAIIVAGVLFLLWLYLKIVVPYRNR